MSMCVQLAENLQTKQAIKKDQIKKTHKTFSLFREGKFINKGFILKKKTDTRTLNFAFHYYLYGNNKSYDFDNLIENNVNHLHSLINLTIFILTL